MLKPKSPKQEQGFTLVEVLVAILITTLFVGIAMQSMVFAAIFKARAQEFSEATTWIQQDLEAVKYDATRLQYTLLVDETNGDSDPGNHEPTDTVLYVNSVYGFKVGDALRVGADSTNNTIQSIDMNNKTITLNTALDTTQPKDQIVVATTRCNAASVDTGFADGLRDWITDTDYTNGITDITGDDYFVNIPKTINRTSKTFTLKRTTTISSPARPSVAPHNLLRVSYEVLPASGGSSVANFYTEVIPNAAFQCP